MNASRIRVKFCGMTRVEDIVCAVDLGVDAIGLIFYPKSSRYVNLEHAQRLLKEIPPFISTVAVLVDPDRQQVEEILSKLPIHLLQFHGDESPEFCEQFNKPFIKAIQPESMDHIKRDAARFFNADMLLLDTPSMHQKGGTGLAFDWEMIPKNDFKPYVLAGGINTSNISDAVQLKPYAIDICSGIEDAPGVKNHLKMNQIIKAVWGHA